VQDTRQKTKGERQKMERSGEPVENNRDARRGVSKIQDTRHKIQDKRQKAKDKSEKYKVKSIK
jgi:hypothetical protein